MSILFRPYSAAADIVNLPTREERAKAIESVPDEFREMVRKLVEMVFSARARRRKET